MVFRDRSNLSVVCVVASDNVHGSFRCNKSGFSVWLYLVQIRTFTRG